VALQNSKRWFAWLCLAMMLVSEIFLFRASREKDAALAEARDAQAQLHQSQKDLDDLKNSSGGLQFAETLKLHKQIDIYTNRLAKAQAMIDRLQAESAQAAQNLANARAALSAQQQHLQDLQVENKIVTDAGLAIVRRNACINNLRELDAAKAQWALDKEKTAADVPTAQDLLPYLRDGIFPACPDGGTYYLNNLETLPACTVQGHVLPQ
jgi:chromosome segregation ATPase